MSTPLLTSGLTGKLGEQANKLETLDLRSFENLGGKKMQRIKVRVLVINSDQDVKGWNPWESEASKGEDAVVLDNSMAVSPLPSDH